MCWSGFLLIRISLGGPEDTVEVLLFTFVIFIIFCSLIIEILSAMAFLRRFEVALYASLNKRREYSNKDELENWSLLSHRIYWEVWLSKWNFKVHIPDGWYSPHNPTASHLNSAIDSSRVAISGSAHNGFLPYFIKWKLLYRAVWMIMEYWINTLIFRVWITSPQHRSTYMAIKGIPCPKLCSLFLPAFLLAFLL